MVVGFSVFLKVPLVAAGGDGVGVPQGQDRRKAALIPGILDPHPPVGAVGLGPQHEHVAAQRNFPAFDAVGPEGLLYPIGSIALGDAPQVDGLPLPQRYGIGRFLLNLDLIAVDVFQQLVQFGLLRHPEAVSSEAPGIHDGGDGDVEGAVCGIPVFQRRRKQRPRPVSQAGGRRCAVMVDAGHIAVRLCAGEFVLQRLDLPLRFLDGFLRLGAIGRNLHHRVHGEDLGSSLRCLFSAACQAQAQGCYQN